MENKTIIINKYGGLCNTIKNFLSCIRIQKKYNCNLSISRNNNILNNYFNIPDSMYSENNSQNNIISRSSWRLAIFNDDKNIDKVINNKYSLMFQDFTDHIFFNYNNNCIDFLYRQDLFNEIYEDYNKRFSELIIKDEILNEIQSFQQLHFNENTISIHIRTWNGDIERSPRFDINRFYNKIEEYNNGINKFFVCSDNMELLNNIKNKYENSIILYESISNVKDFIELMLLSKNNILFGTELSTFTEMAYIINYNKNKKIFIL
jgi:hypothetical protein